jgi:two-component system, LytTR family, sensor kinase
MKRKMYNMAIFTSPIMAVYGVCPLYIFNILDISKALALTFGLTFNAFISWAIVIEIKLKFPKLNNYWLFVYSYILSVLFRLVLTALLWPFDIAKPPVDDQYLAYPIVTSFALNGIILIILDSMVKTNKYMHSERELQELKFQNSEAQKFVLMQQLHPHFLFNALSNLKSLIKDNAEVAEEYTIKLSEFLRYSVASHQSQVVTVNQELDFTMDYIELQKIRFGSAFSYEINIPDNTMKYQMPVLALQTLIENIFKHNYFTEKNPMYFTINFVGNSLIVWNKKKSVKLTSRHSTGLANLQKRYDLIMQKHIIIDDKEDSFSVNLPLIVI